VIDLLVSGALIVLLDQGSKAMVQAHASGRVISFAPVFRIRRVRTVRQVYGTENARALLVLIWLTAFLSAVILHSSTERIQGHIAVIGLGSALGGAAGNLLDILRRRFVLDFIDLGWWPVFNLADVAIVGGLVLALWPRA